MTNVGSPSFIYTCICDLHTCSCRDEAGCQQHACKPFYDRNTKILSDKTHTQHVSLDISKTFKKIMVRGECPCSFFPMSLRNTCDVVLIFLLEAINYDIIAMGKSVQ